MQKHRSILAVIISMVFAAVLVAGCDQNSEVGTLDGACLEDGSCEEGLVCNADNVCEIDDERFVDNLDGTVTDKLTNLIWLKDAFCFGNQDWTTAMSLTAGLNSGECGLSDGSEEGDWRQPTLSEFQEMGTYPSTSWSVIAGYSLVYVIDRNSTAPKGVAWQTPGEPFVNVQDEKAYWTTVETYYSEGEYGGQRVWSCRMEGIYTLMMVENYIYNEAPSWPVRSDN